MLQRIRSILLLSAFVTLTPAAVHAGAVLFIYPTLIMFEGNERSAEITLTNRGDAIGTFETSWSDLTMTPDGGLMKYDGEAPWSVRPYVRHSPRRVTLEPGASQVIKIALRRGQDDIPDGEYYSHFKVLTLNSEDPVDTEPEEPDKAAAIRIEARTAIAIPIIWRNSQETPAASIDTVRIDPQANQLAVEVQRLGPLSVRGYLHVFSTAVDGTRTSLAEPVPLVIYPSLDARAMTVTLNDDVRADQLPRHTDLFYSTDLDVTDKSVVYASHALMP